MSEYYESLISGGLVEYRREAIVPNLIKQITFADSPYTASWGDDLEVDATDGNVIVNLPTAVNRNGRMIWIAKIDSSINEVQIETFGSETIYGDTEDVIENQFTVVGYKSNGTNIAKR